MLPEGGVGLWAAAKLMAVNKAVRCKRTVLVSSFKPVYSGMQAAGILHV